MGRGEDGRARRPGRFGTSGSTRHDRSPRGAAPPPPAAPPGPPRQAPRSSYPYPPDAYPPPYLPDGRPDDRYPPDGYPDAYPPPYQPDGYPGDRYPDDGRRPVRPADRRTQPDPYAYRPYPPDPYPPADRHGRDPYPTERYPPDPRPRRGYRPDAYAEPYDAYPHDGYPHDGYPHDAYPPDRYETTRYAPGPPPTDPSRRPYPPDAYPPDAYRPDAYPPGAYPPDANPPGAYPARDYRDDRTRALPPGAPPPGSGTLPLGGPHQPLPVAPSLTPGAGGGKPPSPTVTRVVADRTKYLSGVVRQKIVSASEADGARESGLTALLWNQVMSLAADAMITVALAGTVFFAASGTQQRGNVLQYLLITVAPFALVAPVIGPLLDRLQHGRRIAMGATAIGRAVLALVMASRFNDMLVLLPCALGALVLSKAYAVLRGSAAPRLVPPSMTLVTANARLSIFGLGATAVGGGALAAFLKVTGSYQWGLRLTAVAFAATAFYAFKLPKTIDSPQGGPRPMPIAAATVPAAKLLSSARLREWSKRGFADEMLTTLQAQCAMRGIIGFLTLFMAFYIQDTSHGFDAVVDLAMFAAAAGGASFVGTAIGARLKLGRPEAVVFLCMIISAAACVVTVLTFGTTMAIVCVALCGVGNALGKLSLDAVIQRDVQEALRSSAFARSETFLQLAWVLGAALAVMLPAGHGQLDFLVATVAFGGSVAAVAVRRQTIKGQRAAGKPAAAPYDPGYGRG